MIKLNSNKGREIVSNYITALNGDEESIKWANDNNYGKITININDIVGIQFQN